MIRFNRCFKLCLACVQVVPKERDYSLGAKAAKTSDVGGDHGDAPGQRRRRRPPRMPTVDVTPILELCMARMDPAGELVGVVDA